MCCSIKCLHGFNVFHCAWEQNSVPRALRHSLIIPLVMAVIASQSNIQLCNDSVNLAHGTFLCKIHCKIHKYCGLWV